MPIELRPYQSDMLDRGRAEYRAGNRSVVFVAPCRSGKTVTFAFMSSGIAGRGQRALILAHREALIEQASETFTRIGVEHGLILSGRSGNTLPVQLGMIGTVARRLDRIAPPDWIIVDEAHRAVSKTYRSILDAFQKARVAMFTATPARTDGRGLGEVATALVMGPQPKELISLGNICQPRVFVPPIDADLSAITKTAGDYDVSQQAARLDRATVTGDVIAHYRTYAGGKSFIAFCAGVKHAAHVAEQFTAAGIPTLNIDGTHTREERRQIMTSLRSGAVLGITSADLISEGVDLPSVHATIHLRKTASVIIYVQQTSRSLTPEPGKTHGVILDHVGNFERFGWPHADREWSLDGAHNHNKRAAEKTIAVRRCRVCFACYEPHLLACPHCGAAAATESRRIEQRDGQLVEVSEETERQTRLAAGPYFEALKSCQTPEQVKEMAKARGLKPGWSIRQVMAKRDVGAYEAAKLLGYNPAIVRHLRIGGAR